MRLNFIRNSFLKDNSYLLFGSLLLLFISLFTQRTDTKNFFTRSYAKKIQAHIINAENDFKKVITDTAFLNNVLDQTLLETEIKKITAQNQYYYFYNNTDSIHKLVFWNTQAVLPDSTILKSTSNFGFVLLVNGYYYFQKTNVERALVISLLPIKWNYAVTNDYIKNEFTQKINTGSKLDISTATSDFPILTSNGNFLFSVFSKDEADKVGENKITIWLRLLSFLPLLLFLHFTTIHIHAKRGIYVSSIFLALTLICIRSLTYLFYSELNFRQFELFNPAIYGSNIVLRSLGDLLINVLVFLWVINFIKNNFKENESHLATKNIFTKWFSLSVATILVLIATFVSGNILQSMVSDSQISFDVMNFFSLNAYSVIGFLVLCSITIGYYYFCSIVLSFVLKLFNGSTIAFFFLISVFGLLFLSFMIGKLTNGFELYALIWLLLFLFLIRKDLVSPSNDSRIISRMVFWLFFFSLSITSVIITENNSKEFANRRHYAEVLAAKTNPISDVLLNTILTEFRPVVLANNFYLLKNINSSTKFRDSLVNNNFNSYSDNFETKVLVYDSIENPLFNQDPVSYNSISSIYNTQAKPTEVPGMYYYDTGYDKFNYLAKRVIKDENGNLLGYVFIVVSPKSFLSETLYPELFSRGQNNSLENSSEYAFAIYDQGKLISSHNDYAFSTRYSDKYFAGKQFLLEKNKNYNELWYSAGSNKYVLIVKENRLIIESITLFSYLFCTFILLNALSTFISIFLKARFNISKIIKEVQLTIRQQVHGTIIFFSILSFIIIAIATILFFISRYQNNNKETLSRTIKIIGSDVSAAVSKQLIETSLFEQNKIAKSDSLEKIINRISKIHGLDINLYSLNGDLKASSLALPYVKGITSTKISPLAFYHLYKGKEIQYYQNEKIGTLEYASDYIPITIKGGEEIGYLNIPYFTSQTKLKEEISTFLVTIIILNAFILLMSGIVALIITNRITNSFSFISDKMKNINLAKTNEAIVWNRNDEIGDLVKEYNKMVVKLDISATALARTERENAWQEMAKQVAHEIKNPLTPMKLSMQFLHRAIKDDAPNIKELSSKVSDTLVEQIDHLSSIAEEFSRFANIENAKPELFNVKESLISVKQLYEVDSATKFTWKIIPNEVLIFADKTHINRILTNLILNGIQSVAENETPHIHIYETVNSNTVEIKISDNGIGISDEVKSKIFTPNFTTKSSGTGLGLAMCKRMAEQAGGDIRFETSANGTSFFVTLPITNA